MARKQRRNTAKRPAGKQAIVFKNDVKLKRNKISFSTSVFYRWFLAILTSCGK